MAGQIAAGEVPVVRPQPLADFRHRRARQQQPTLPVLEGILDAAHRKTACQHLDGRTLKCFPTALQVSAQFGAERLGRAGNPRRTTVDRPFRRLQPATPDTVAIAAAGAMSAVLAVKRLVHFRLQTFFNDQTRRKPNRFRATALRRQTAFDQIGQASRLLTDAGILSVMGVLPYVAGSHKPLEIRHPKGCTPCHLSRKFRTLPSRCLNVWRSIPPIRAASVRFMPSQTAANAGSRRIGQLSEHRSARRRKLAASKSRRRGTAAGMASLLCQGEPQNQ